MDNNQHSPPAPSSAQRWMPCPGSVMDIQLLGGIDTSSPAQSGTDSHTYLEQGLTLGLPPTLLDLDDPEEREKVECAEALVNE